MQLQPGGRKIQDLGLATTYKGEKDIKLFCGMMDSLAFLPCGQVKDGMDYLQSICPEELEDLLAYFNTTYVNGSYKRIQTPPALGSEQPVLRMRLVFDGSVHKEDLSAAKELLPQTYQQKTLHLPVAIVMMVILVR